jgi:hypothetical protein
VHVAAGGSQARQELLSRLQARNPTAAAAAAPPPDYDQEVTIFPKPAWSGETCAAVGILILALVFLTSIWLFRASVHRPTPPPAVAVSNDNQGLGLIRRDLVDIMRRYLGKRTVYTEVTHTGSESRVFKYFLARLDQGDDCPGLARLEIRASVPAEGFSAEAVCLNQDGLTMSRRLELQVRWTRTSAVARFPGRPGTDEVEMFPSL